MIILDWNNTPFLCKLCEEVMLNIWLRVVLCFSVSWCSELSLKLVIFVLKYHWKVIKLHVCGNPDRWKCHFVDCQSTHMVQMTKGGGWGCEVSCGGHHRQRGKTTTGSALDGAVLDFTQILAYLVHNMSKSQLYFGFGHFGWLPFFFFRPITF